VGRRAPRLTGPLNRPARHQGTVPRRAEGGDGSGSAGGGDAPAAKPPRAARSSSPKRGAKKSTNTAGSKAESAARDVLYSSSDLAAGAIGATAGAAEAAAEAMAGAADDAVAAAQGVASSLARDVEGAADDALTAAQGVASSLAREVEDATEAATEAAGNFVFATASMADAAAAAVLGEGGVGAGGGGAGSSAATPTTTPPEPVLSAAQLKQQLVQAVAGLDRGLGASLREARAVDALARRLERAAPADSSTTPLGPLAPGCWRLIYSSAFGGGSLGGSRPGPPAALTPLVLGGVFQVVDRERKTLDNVVELLAPGLVAPPPLKALVAAPLKALSSALGGALAGESNGGGVGWVEEDEDDDEDDDPTPGVRLTLRHDYEILSGPPPSRPSSSSSSSSSAATVRIVFEDTLARALGPSFLASRLPRVSAPQLPEALRPPRGLRAATFDVSYQDAEMRVTRGDRGELRVFLRDLGRGMDAAPLSRRARQAEAQAAAAAAAAAAPARAFPLPSMEE
jgi:hypothetical protein